jgi:hypothetical protein
VQLKQGSLCYFDGFTNLEGRHGTRPLCSDGNAHLEARGHQPACACYSRTHE